MITFCFILCSLAAPGTCDFEAGLCGYGHDPNADFQWTNNTGSTYSQFTGPSGDHSTGAGRIDFFNLCILLSQFRPRDVTLEIFFFKSRLIRVHTCA